jgi:hypothetical protein
MAIRDVEDGRTIVNFLTPEGPAESAGIALSAEILTWNGQPLDAYIDGIVPFSSPFLRRSRAPLAAAALRHTCTAGQ